MGKQIVIGALTALAHETRLDVFRLLVHQGGEGLSPGAIAAELDVPPATLSFHLKELKSAGVVACRREGRSLLYRPHFQAMNGLLEFLTRNCCQGAAGCGPAAAEDPQP